jgi:hypothetical protein
MAKPKKETRPMKTTLRVVVLVDVWHASPRELAEAIRDLGKRAPHKDTVVAGDFGSYSAKTRPRAAVMKAGRR